MLCLKPVTIRRKSNNSSLGSWGNGEVSGHRSRLSKPGPRTTWTVPAVPTERAPNTSSISTASICPGEPLTSSMPAARLRTGHAAELEILLGPHKRDRKMKFSSLLLLIMAAAWGQEMGLGALLVCWKTKTKGLHICRICLTDI